MGSIDTGINVLNKAFTINYGIGRLQCIQITCQLLDSYWVATCMTVYWGVVISTGSKRDAVFIERRVVSFDTL